MAPAAKQAQVQSVLFFGPDLHADLICGTITSPDHAPQRSDAQANTLHMPGFSPGIFRFFDGRWLIQVACDDGGCF
jgi:hypothetical protein